LVGDLDAKIAEALAPLRPQLEALVAGSSKPKSPASSATSSASRSSA
jgi:hypothetical protein